MARSAPFFFVYAKSGIIYDLRIYPVFVFRCSGAGVLRGGPGPSRLIRHSRHIQVSTMGTWGTVRGRPRFSSDNRGGTLNGASSIFSDLGKVVSTPVLLNFSN
jgi:hypothetical protein